jgi:hypothetical protein
MPVASLFDELKRRNVFRVAVAYTVVAWLVLEIAEILIPIMKLPDWTLAMVLFIGIVGFPFALVFAWAFELTPEGIKRAEDVAPGEENTGKTLNRVIIAVLGLAVVLLLADRLLVDQAALETVAESDAQTGETEPKSIAVLPFVNMSDDPEQEYFSDGISEELLVGLAYFDDLQVAARTSAFSFKGQNADVTIRCWKGPCARRDKGCGLLPSSSTSKMAFTSGPAPSTGSSMTSSPSRMRSPRRSSAP